MPYISLFLQECYSCARWAADITDHDPPTEVSITTPSGEVKTQECLAGADIVVQVDGDWGGWTTEGVMKNGLQIEPGSGSNSL